MSARAILLPVFGAMALLTAACDKGGDGKDKDAKEAKADKKKNKADSKETKEDDGEPTLQVAEGDEGAQGPVPPESSMVFFQVEGGLIPLACFNKDGGAIKTGTACLEMVPADAQVRVSAGDQAFNKKVGERVEPTCLAGSGKKVALSAENLTGGAEFSYGAWPPSTLKAVTLVSSESTTPAKTQVDDDTKAKLAKAVPVKGDLSVHQVAEIDLDGNANKDGVYSVLIPNPKMAEQYRWSGIFLARDGNLDDLLLIAKSRSKKDVFEVMGVFDLDGAGTRELWMRMIFEEGSGDAVFQLNGDAAKPLGKWSCGV